MPTALADRLSVAHAAAEDLAAAIVHRAPQPADAAEVLRDILQALVHSAPDDAEPEGKRRSQRRRELQGLAFELGSEPRPHSRGRPRRPTSDRVAGLAGTGPLGPFVVGVDDTNARVVVDGAAVSAPTPEEATAIAELAAKLRERGQPLRPSDPMYDRAFRFLARRLDDGEPLSREERGRWAVLAARRADALTAPPHRAREERRNALILALARCARRYAGAPLDRQCAAVVRALFGERAVGLSAYREQRRRQEKAASGR